LGSATTFGPRSVSCVLVALTAVIATAPLVADSVQSQLSVSVTVARSCVVDAQTVIGGDPRLRLTCAAGAARDVHVTQTISTPAAVATDSSHNSLRVLTLNF
jgi:hypothetical protein